MFPALRKHGGENRNLFCPLVCFVPRSGLGRPVIRVGVVGGKTGQNLLIMRRFAVHIFYRGLGLLQPFIGFLSLLKNDSIPCPQIFLRLLQKAKSAIFPNVLD